MLVQGQASCNLPGAVQLVPGVMILECFPTLMLRVQGWMRAQVRAVSWSRQEDPGSQPCVVQLGLFRGRAYDLRKRRQVTPGQDEAGG